MAYFGGLFGTKEEEKKKTSSSYFGELFDKTSLARLGAKEAMGASERANSIPGFLSETLRGSTSGAKAGWQSVETKPKSLMALPEELPKAGKASFKILVDALDDSVRRLQERETAFADPTV